ncbi:hypothetical protein ACH4KO_29150 [Streptomyces anulatus]
MRFTRRNTALATVAAAAVTAGLLVPGASGAETATAAATATATATDPNVPAVCADRRPGPADPGAYGMQLDGTFRHPALTPVDEESDHSFPGRNAAYDTRSYIKNMKVEAAYEGADFTPDYFHTWQNVVDFDGRRYLFQYDRSEGRVYDITNVRKVRVVERMSREDVGGVEARANGDWAAHDYWGASTVQWNKKLNAYVMVQSFESRRQISELSDHPPLDKYNNPDGVRKLREKPGLKGFKVYRLDGPRKKDWNLLATVSTDSTRADPLRSDPATAQQGSGSIDAPGTAQVGRYHRLLPAARQLRPQADRLLHQPGQARRRHPRLRLLQRGRAVLRRVGPGRSGGLGVLRAEGVRPRHGGLRVRQPDPRGLRGVGPEHRLGPDQPRHLRPVVEGPGQARPRRTRQAVPQQRILTLPPLPTTVQKGPTAMASPSDSAPLAPASADGTRPSPDPGAGAGSDKGLVRSFTGRPP